jgi:hypothetical protein
MFQQPQEAAVMRRRGVPKLLYRSNLSPLSAGIQWEMKLTAPRWHAVQEELIVLPIVVLHLEDMRRVRTRLGTDLAHGIIAERLSRIDGGIRLHLGRREELDPDTPAGASAPASHCLPRKANAVVAAQHVICWEL